MRRVLFLISILILTSCGQSSSRARRTGSGGNFTPIFGDDSDFLGGFNPLEVTPGEIISNLKKLDGKVSKETVLRRLNFVLKKNNTIDGYIDSSSSNFQSFSSPKNKQLKRNEFLFNFGEEDEQVELPSYHYSSLSGLKGLKVALDPKFIGGDLAITHEKRYVRLIDGSEAVHFSEAAVNYYIAELVKFHLEAQGVDVLTTKEYIHDPIYKKDFSTYRNNDYARDVDNYVRRNYKGLEEQQRQRERLLSETNERVYYDFYRPLVTRTRAQMINKFSPHLSLRIGMHSNGGINPVNGNTVSSGPNFSLAFIPGGYTEPNFKTASSRFYFLRFLFTPVLDYSQRIASSLLQAIAGTTQVEPIASSSINEGDPLLLESKIVFEKIGEEEKPAPGLFAKIPSYFEYVQSPVVELRAVTQDNTEEARLLYEGLKEVATLTHDYKQVSANNRLMQIANGYFRGILNFYTKQASPSF